MRIKHAGQMEQPTLFVLPSPQKEFGSNGAARSHYGQVVQSAVCGILGLAEIENSGAYDVVFDAQCRRSKQFFEIKSVHATNKVPLYVWRLQKDEDSGVAPIYLFGIHKVRGARSIQECWEKMGESLTRIIALKHSTVTALTADVKLRQLVKERKGSRMGYERKGYCDGYKNLSVGAICEAAPELALTYVCNVNGVLFRGDIFAEPGLSPFLDKKGLRD